jgi:hypothetical protein
VTKERSKAALRATKAAQQGPGKERKKERIAGKERKGRKGRKEGRKGPSRGPKGPRSKP